MSKQIDLEKLRERVEYFHRRNEAAPITNDEVLALLGHIAALEKDAARYRWLRDKTEWEPFDESWLCKTDLYGQGAEDMDEFIDTAMEASNAKAD